MDLKHLIEQCEENPVLSRHHHWKGQEQSDFDSLHVHGRRLYDNLRTQFDLSHTQAFVLAVQHHGFNKTYLRTILEGVTNA